MILVVFPIVLSYLLFNFIFLDESETREPIYCPSDLSTEYKQLIDNDKSSCQEFILANGVNETMILKNKQYSLTEAC